MPKSQRWRVCSTPGCPEYSQGGRCANCQRDAERKRGSARQRGYGGRHQTKFRPAVLARDPACVCTDQDHGHRDPCGRASVHADHWPLSRRELTTRGLDPDDPQYGRGLCQPCHSSETAANQPGGWNQ